ncbi:Coa4 protein [Saccharomycopsis crataegensis]|uniref:Coa4 protein n=1 Tax=Saccharomycopsis crataegensis TaxID=43959 RepID=A0AAV5QPR8_9ASCO|nr:Coa4 protein [Saccharomycopsis crataegensis]
MVAKKDNINVQKEISQGSHIQERNIEQDEQENGNEPDDDDEPDEWDKRIIKTGCAKENFDLQICYADKRDWRQCTKEMEVFRNCWKQHNNDERTHTKDY